MHQPHRADLFAVYKPRAKNGAERSYRGASNRLGIRASSCRQNRFQTASANLFSRSNSDPDSDSKAADSNLEQKSWFVGRAWINQGVLCGSSRSCNETESFRGKSQLEVFELINRLSGQFVFLLEEIEQKRIIAGSDLFAWKPLYRSIESHNDC